ncbi:hypothetical protein MTO96_019874 [Rhipicephalus appendiculatus]
MKAAQRARVSERLRTVNGHPLGRRFVFCFFFETRASSIGPGASSLPRSSTLGPAAASGHEEGRAAPGRAQPRRALSSLADSSRSSTRAGHISGAKRAGPRSTAQTRHHRRRERDDERRARRLLRV